MDVNNLREIDEKGNLSWRFHVVRSRDLSRFRISFFFFFFFFILINYSRSSYRIVVLYDRFLFGSMND